MRLSARRLRIESNYSVAILSVILCAEESCADKRELILGMAQSMLLQCVCFMQLNLDALARVIVMRLIGFIAAPRIGVAGNGSSRCSAVSLSLSPGVLRRARHRASASSTHTW